MREVISLENTNNEEQESNVYRRMTNKPGPKVEIPTWFEVSVFRLVFFRYLVSRSGDAARRGGQNDKTATGLRAGGRAAGQEARRGEATEEEGEAR